MQQHAVESHDCHTNGGFLKNVAEALFASSEHLFCLLVLSDISQHHQAASNSEVPGASIQGGDTQVEVVQYFTFTQGDLCICFAHMVGVLQQFWPGGEYPGEQSPDCL